MRIVTRPDFDGIVCAVLLSDVENITEPIQWVEPHDMHRGTVAITKNDIIANLSFHKNCALWFDHHISNQIDRPFKGLFKIAPSAARNIFEFYKNRFNIDYSELVAETDSIDSARLLPAEVINPAKNPYVLISMTVSGFERADEYYWNKLVYLLKRYDIDIALKDSEVKRRVNSLIEENIQYKKHLTDHTRMEKQVSITDFLGFDTPPSGNRFLVFTLFPESTVNIKIRCNSKNKGQVIISIGHNIFNRNCRVDIGKLVKNYGGGGHHGAGSCSVDIKEYEKSLSEMIKILLKNEK